jgi:hypothetical protein
VEAATRAIEMAQSWDDVREHTQMLTELAKGGLEETVIRLVELNQSRNAAWERTLMIASLLPFVPNQAELLKAIRSGMLARLGDLRSEKRADILYFSADDVILTAPVLSQYQLATLSTDVFRICRDWHWS